VINAALGALFGVKKKHRLSYAVDQLDELRGWDGFVPEKEMMENTEAANDIILAPARWEESAGILDCICRLFDAVGQLPYGRHRRVSFNTQCLKSALGHFGNKPTVT
jgi:hypothetical protein